MKFVDICSGLGGFRVALENIIPDAECILSADIKPDAIKTYNLNFNETNESTDLYDIKDLPPFDLLMAGFPCQPFSSAGQKKGFEDRRGGVIFKILDICQKSKPKYVVLENVSNLITINQGESLRRIVAEFRNIGYQVSYKKLNSADFGVPQVRERVFVVCHREREVDMEAVETRDPVVLGDVLEMDQQYTDLPQDFVKKILKIHSKSSLHGYRVQDKRGGGKNIHSWDLDPDLTEGDKTLMNLIMTERRKKKWAAEKGIPWMDGMPLTTQEIKTFHDVPDLQGILDRLTEKKLLRLEKPKTLNDNGKRVYHEEGIPGYNICKGKLSFPISNILDPRGTSPTLTATDCNKLAVIGKGFMRKLTPREMARISGFPDTYQLLPECNNFDLFGNTVVPPVVEAVLRQTLDA
jgi:DNA (cytosine-5)-methyltransferase 1